MPSKKKRNKARRYVEKTMDQAWDALRKNSLNLAEKLSKRACDCGRVNPRIWNDRGQILLHCEQDEDAEKAFRYSIALAPTYVDPMKELALLYTRSGSLEQARNLLLRILELTPDDGLARDRLRTLQALAKNTVEQPVYSSLRKPTLDLNLSARCDWIGLTQELTEIGCARIPGLLSGDECQRLIALFSQPSRFEHTVKCDDKRGRVTYQFFREPLPELVASLRSEVYARLAEVANHWNVVLGKKDRFPVVLDSFLGECRKAGQDRSAPILLRYPASGFNAPHRDLAGEVFFPFQLAITLSPGNSVDGSGNFQLLDEAAGKKVCRSVATRIGDGVVFCTRHRLARVGGRFGLQAVLHGITSVQEERYALGIPFHDFRGAAEDDL